MRYNKPWEYRMGIGFLTVWILMLCWTVPMFFVFLTQGNMFAVLYIFFIGFVIWNIKTYTSEIRDYRQRNRLGKYNA